MVASFEWVKDPYQNTPEGYLTAEEEIFIDFAANGRIKIKFSYKSLFDFLGKERMSFFPPKTREFRIL